MFATVPVNRLAGHYGAPNTPPATLPALPKSARERGGVWSDAVLHAVLTLQKQLTHQDVDIAAAAANSIIELERTRIRHGRTVAGSELVSEAQLQYEEEERRKFDWMDETPVRPAAAAVAESPPAAAGARSEERAFAEHVEEVAAYSEASDDPLGAPPEQFARWLLNKWALPALAVPKGGFMDRLRRHGMRGPSAKKGA